MNSPDANRLVTTNLAEVCYLLENAHTLVDVEMVMGNMGAEEILFTLEGENIMITRRLFMSDTRVSVSKIPAALETIRNLFWKKEEETMV